MIIGIVTFGANRQKKLLRCFADAAYPEVSAARRVGRFPILRLEPLRYPPMFDGCFRLPVFREKCGKGVLRRDRLRIVSDELVVDLLHTQTLFCRYVGIRERRCCLMGRFDFYRVFAHAPMDSARASTGVKSRMKSVAAALLHLLPLLRPRSLIITAVALPGEITFT